MLTQLSRHRATGAEDLVDHLGECHERIRRFTILARQAGSWQDVPADQIAQACIDVERYFTQALPLHVADEEQSIEPRLRGLSPRVDQALDAVAQQHRQHEPELKALLRATSMLRNNPNDRTTRGEVATFDLAAGEPRDEEPYIREGQTARTLVRTPNLRIVVALKRNKTNSEHQRHRVGEDCLGTSS